MRRISILELVLSSRTQVSYGVLLSMHLGVGYGFGCC
jgi:hypothetical protein